MCIYTYIYIHPGELPHYGGFWPVPGVLCGVAKYVGSGDGVPQHGSGGSEKTARFRHRGWKFSLEVEF